MAVQTSALDGDSAIYRRRWWTLALVSLAWGVTSMGTSILNVALPTMQRDLHASSSDLQWIVNAYNLAVAALLITMGALGDRVGRAHALRAGIIAFASGSILAMTANSSVVVIISRVIMGIGCAAVMPATLAIITHSFPVKERGKAVAIWAGILGIAIALGPIVGGLLIRYFSWHAVFFFNVPFSIAVLAGSAFLVPNSRNPDARRVDLPGMLLSGAGLAILVYGLIQAGMGGWTDSTVYYCLAGAAALIVLFVLWERHTTTPMLDVNLFANLRFSAGCMCVTTATLIYSGLLFSLTMYLQFVRGYSALHTGVLFLPVGIGCMVGSWACDRQVDSFGLKWTITSGLLMLVAIVAAMGFWTTGTPYWIMAPVIFIASFAMNNISPPGTASIVSSVPASRAGEVSPIAPLSMLVGGTVGVALMGSVLSAQYAASIASNLAGKVTLSADSMALVQKSVGSAAAAADRLPAGVGEVVRTAAHSSFMDGWRWMALVTCIIALAGAAVAIRFLPPRLSPQTDEAKTRSPAKQPVPDLSSTRD